MFPNALFVTLFLVVLLLPSVSTYGQPSWWIHEGGASYDNGGSVGVAGTFSPTVWPGSRSQAASWGPFGVGGTTHFYGFGLGFYNDSSTLSSTGPVKLNDLFEFDSFRTAAEGRFRLVREDASLWRNTTIAPDPFSYDVANLPGGRSGPFSWTTDHSDPTSTLLLFGGYGYGIGDVTSSISLCDMWEFDPVSTNWRTLTNGLYNCTAVSAPTHSFGERNVSSISNLPPARSDGVSWTTADSRYFLFGGLVEPQTEYWNDLWEFELSTGHWIWRHGSSSPTAARVCGSIGTFGSANSPGAMKASCGWVGGGGSSLYLFGGRNASRYFADLWEYDIDTNRFRVLSGNCDVDFGGSFTLEFDLSPTNHPRGLYGAAPFRIPSRPDTLFFYGGFDGDDYTSTMWYFSLTELQWSYVDSLSGRLGSSDPFFASPHAIRSSAIFENSEETYLIGGYGYAYKKRVSTCNPRPCGTKTKYYKGHVDELYRMRDPIYSCYNVSAFDLASVCAGHGECASTDNCTCMMNYTSFDDCSDWDCFGISRHNLSSVCGSIAQGECLEYNVCDCDWYYEGEECLVEKVTCFGYTYDSYYSVCSEHGDCVANGNCSCDTYSSFAFYGQVCEELIDHEAIFAEEDIIKFSYNIEIDRFEEIHPSLDLDNVLPCNLFLTSESISLLGAGGTCQLTSNYHGETGQFEIALGSDATITPDDELGFIVQIPSSGVPGSEIVVLEIATGMYDGGGLDPSDFLPPGLLTYLGAGIGVGVFLLVVVAVVVTIVVVVVAVVKQQKQDRDLEMN